MRRVSVLALVAAFAFAGAAVAQVSGPAVFSPVAPTDRDQIRATFTFDSPGCGFADSTVVAGHVVRTTVNVFGCLLGQPAIETHPMIGFGPLPANTYTYELYWSYESGPPQFVSQQQLVVSAAPAAIPALSVFAYLALVAGLAALALFVLGRPAGQ